MSEVSGMKLTRAPCVIHLEREGGTDGQTRAGGRGPSGGGGS